MSEHVHSQWPLPLSERRTKDSVHCLPRSGMPKEQGHFGDWVTCSTSKNAKDKSNSATLRASQGGTHRDLSGMGDMSSRMLRCDSEKDSGYSEAGSDSVQTDVDDQRSSVSEPHRESSLNATGHSMPPYEELTPIYVIKNLVVKPSRRDQLLHGPLAWGGGWHSITGAKAPTQLLLIQQPAMPAPSSSSPTPNPSPSLAKPQGGQTKKGGSRSNNNHSSNNSYLPILNSYPRIAPHPRKEGREEGKVASGVGGVKESGSEGQSQSKRVCTEEEKRGPVSTTSHRLKPHQTEGRVHSHSQHRVRGGHASFPNPPHCPLSGHASSSTTTHPKTHRCHQSSRSDSVGSPSISSSQTPSPPFSSDSPSSDSPSSSVAHSPYRPAPKAAGGSSLSDSQSECLSIHQRRFLNTAEILNQTGLLAITLRAKELLKQNAATEREIAQLRQHAHLLCQVAQAGQQGSNSLDKLLQAMTETDSYPNLDLNQLKALSSNHQQSKTRDEDNKERASNGRNNKAHTNPLQNLVSLSNVDDETSPPSPLFAPSPEAEGTEYPDGLSDVFSASHSTFRPRPVPEQGRRQAGMYKDLTDLTMSPESSAHNKYLL